MIARSDDNSNGDCIDEAAEQCLEEMSHYTLMPHELLYLLCNCADRLKMIVDNHKVAHWDSKHAIYRWDLIKSKDNKPAVSNIHVLGRTAFVNKAPRLLVLDGVARLSNERHLKYVGGGDYTRLQGFYEKF